MKKRILCAITFIFFFIVCALKLNQPVKTEEQEMSFAERCWKLVSEYQIVELENGFFAVHLVAPDYKTLLEYLVEQESASMLNEENLIEIARKNPEVVKEYDFVVESKEHVEVLEAFTNEIGNDLCEIILESYEVDNN